MELPSITAEKGKLDKKLNCQILIRVSFNRSHVRQSTGFKVPQNMFTSEGLIDTDVPNAQYKNGIIRDQMRKLELQFMDAARKEPITKSIITAIMSNGKGAGMSVTGLFEALKKKYDGIMKPGTLRLWESSANKLSSYRKRIMMGDLDANVMLQFEQYLRTDLQNANNTVWSTMKTLKSIFGKAVSLGLTDNNPFERYKSPTYKQTKRNYLLAPEALKIEKLADKKTANKTHRLIAAWWTLAYHSGLRDGDLAKWDESKMVRSNRLYFSDSKTATPQFVPLHPGLVRAIERIRQFRNKPTNEACNRFLFEIGNDLDLPFKVTMHTARHSFAVNYLQRGGQLEDLQRLMGHKSIKTTAIYGQITDSRIEAEVSRVLGKK